MLKRVKRKIPEKDKIGQDLFHFSKTVEHGFPNKASAIAFDKTLRLLAIGTSTGFLKIYGKPGVEISADHPTETCIQQLFFLPGQAKIISVCNDGEVNTLHLWEVSQRDGSSVMEEVKSCTLEGRLKKISVCCLSMERECLYIGTEGGHIYVLDLVSFGLKDHIIYQDVVMQNLPGDENKTNGGSVEALSQHPFDSSKLLIGYKKGIIVLWNQDKIKAEGTFKATHELEGFYWHHSASQFVSAHERGMFAIWTVPDTEDGDVLQDSYTPYGPFPCKPIRKVEWQDPFVVFSGGLPRASFGDKHAVSLFQGNAVQVVFEFTSKVLDFLVIPDHQNPREPIALAVLCEQEFVMIDLKSREQGYPTFLPPYLACLHSSNITCSLHCYDCPDELWNRIRELGKKTCGGEQSNEPWPIDGGKSFIDKSEKHHMLLTGHEDGSVKMWDVSQVSMHLMCSLKTSTILTGEDEPPHDHEADDEDWPPFKKVGAFDSLLDDNRLVILKLALCPVTQLLIVGGAAGQVLFYDLSKDALNTPEVETVNMIVKLEGFEWKGAEPLSLKANIDSSNCILPERLVQIQPPAAVTALTLNSFWALAAFGTCHGFAAYDYRSGKVSLVKCTISPTDLANTGGHIQRRKSFAKSLRDSIRRFRSRKSTRGASSRKPRRDDASSSAADRSSPNPRSNSPDDMERAPSARLIDENRVDESLLSLVRCLYFADTFISDTTHHTPTLWAGTNSGSIYVYSITVPEQEKRVDSPIAAEIGKEIKLKHHAPVISIFILDKNGIPLPNGTEVDAGREKPADMTGPHSLLICSEEQFKIFTLPALRPRNKEKLTAMDGSRVRRVGMIKVDAEKDDEIVEYQCMVCLTNLGDVILYAVPSLRAHLKTSAIRKDNICAIQSVVLTRNGQGFYLRSHTEIEGFCLTVDNVIKPKCSLHPGDSSEGKTASEDQATASVPSDEKPQPHFQSPSAKSDIMSAPDIIPEREKLRSSPEAGSYTVTVEKTENHCPTSESTTIVTHEEIIHDGGSTVETKVHKTTERVVSTKTVETVIVNTEEKSFSSNVQEISTSPTEEKSSN